MNRLRDHFLTFVHHTLIHKPISSEVSFTGFMSYMNALTIKVSLYRYVRNRDKVLLDF
jgi:hypothetical protein